MKKEATKYPETEKWAKAHDGGGRSILQFLEWLCENEEAMNMMTTHTHEELLYKYFEIDGNKLERELSSMIESLSNNS